MTGNLNLDGMHFFSLQEKMIRMNAPGPTSFHVALFSRDFSIGQDPRKNDPTRIKPGTNDPRKNDPTRIDPETNDPRKIDPTRIDPDTNDPDKVDPTHVPGPSPTQPPPTPVTPQPAR